MAVLGWNLEVVPSLIQSTHLHIATVSSNLMLDTKYSIPPGPPSSLNLDRILTGHLDGARGQDGLALERLQEQSFGTQI